MTTMTSTVRLPEEPSSMVEAVARSRGINVNTLVVAGTGTGLDHSRLSRSLRIGLLDPALHAPLVSFGGRDRYPGFIDEATVRAVRSAANGPLLDGIERFALDSLVMFVMLNRHQLEVPVDDAVSTRPTMAAGQRAEAGVAHWLAGRVGRVEHAEWRVSSSAERSTR
jgi:prophage maintenance system killer protein